MFFKLLKLIGYVMFAIAGLGVLLPFWLEPELAEKDWNQWVYLCIVLLIMGYAVIHVEALAKRFPQWQSTIAKLSIIFLAVCSFLLFTSDGEVIGAAITAIVTAITFAIGLVFNAKIITETQRQQGKTEQVYEYRMSAYKELMELVDEIRIGLNDQGATFSNRERIGQFETVLHQLERLYFRKRWVVPEEVMAPVQEMREWLQAFVRRQQDGALSGEEMGEFEKLEARVLFCIREDLRLDEVFALDKDK
ncbi:hypothetical protein [Laceyella putida]|uniref:Uncharacterized protein n=1 Tax=Laceyella putida TaxID=110101 RepID=A0ABW2RMR9_9BACL